MLSCPTQKTALVELDGFKMWKKCGELGWMFYNSESGYLNALVVQVDR
jgi:hypothetical protein